MTEKPINVRPSSPRDEEKLYDLLCMAYKENAPYSMNEKKVRHMIAEGARDKVVVIGVADSPSGKELAGSVGAVYSQWWYTEEWHIEECWNFVHPDYRKFNGVGHSISYATQLIDYMKWISESMDMPLHMGILTSTRMESKVRLYKRKMPQVGAAFAYNIQTGHGPIAGDLNHG